MNYKKQPLEKEIIDRLLSHGIWLSDNAPPVTKEKALILIGQAMLDDFIKDFTGLWKNDLFPYCRIRDYKATDEDWRNWLGDDYSNSKYCKEVDKKMDAKMKNRLDAYLELLEEISEKTDEKTAVALLQEISKDRRMEKIREEQGFKNGDQPATDKQKKFMTKLGIEFTDDITKKQASFLIDGELGKIDSD
jgi:hypothetical protein